MLGSPIIQFWLQPNHTLYMFLCASQAVTHYKFTGVPWVTTNPKYDHLTDTTPPDTPDCAQRYDRCLQSQEENSLRQLEL
jgi:hypothetical protein